jgi:citrate lyase beta subunit
VECGTDCVKQSLLLKIVSNGLLPSLRYRRMSDVIDCADLGLTRTESRMELLFPRSQLVTAAKANGLQAIDLVCHPLCQCFPDRRLIYIQVCVDYQDEKKLIAEVEEGRRLGFDGKVNRTLVLEIHAD